MLFWPQNIDGDEGLLVSQIKFPTLILFKTFSTYYSQ